jgi:hypothetical protein
MSVKNAEKDLKFYRGSMKIIAKSIVPDVMPMPLNGFYPLFLRGLLNPLPIVPPAPHERSIRRSCTS